MAGLPLRLPARHVAPTLVVEEVRDRESRELLERMIEYGRLGVEDPSLAALEKARSVARRAGVLGRLSDADIAVLALALEYLERCGQSAAATDDYALQLALTRAGVRVIRIRYRGIKEADGSLELN
jgi:UPF0271 protein